VTGNYRALNAERIEQADHVADQLQQRVAIDLLRGISLAVATHVWRNSVEASLR